MRRERPFMAGITDDTSKEFKEIRDMLQLERQRANTIKTILKSEPFTNSNTKLLGDTNALLSTMDDVSKLKKTY